MSPTMRRRHVLSRQKTRRGICVHHPSGPRLDGLLRRRLDGGRATGGDPLLQASPNVNLQGVGHSVVFDPTKLTGDVVSKADCTSSDNTFTITNDTPKTQKVTEGGSVVVTVPDGQFKFVCLSVAGTTKYGLASNPSAKLKVIAVAGT